MTEFLRSDGERIAYLRRDGARPTVLWLGGFKSDMTGAKATALDAWAARAGRAFVRFDYAGHGASGGAFRDGTIGRWRNDALAAIDRLTQGPLVLVGSSMGGWIATLAALARPDRVAGLLYVAPALDFTEALIWARAPQAVRDAILTDGVWERPSAYDPDPYPITRALIEEGRNHLLLGGPIALRCPVRILHGMADPDVPWEHSLALIRALESPDVAATFVKHGDHRLSAPADIARMERTLEELIAAVRS